MKQLFLIFCFLNTSLACFGQAYKTSAPPLQFAVSLRGSHAVPPNNSERTGSGWFLLEGNVLNFAVGVGWNFWPTSAGIFGPAEPGESGEPIFDWPTYQIGLPPPGEGGGGITYLGGYVLTPEQVEQIRVGLWYVSVFFPDGEIRGQICPGLPGFDCDGDGVLNADDLCPNTPPDSVVDATGCSIAELVPCNGPWKNHQAYVNAAREQAFRFWKEGRLSVSDRNEIVKQAKESTCGEPPPRPVVPRL